MSDFRKFTLGLAASFGVPWLLLIVVPVIRYQNLEPVPYDKEVDGVEGYYPPSGIDRQGQLVYAREGCVQCHSQMIRPAQLAMDAWHQGWGEDQSPRPENATRANTLRDYLGEPYAFLGLQRIGPDLTNVGFRFEDRATIHQMLYAPRSLNDWSVMPAYTHLYKVQKLQGPPSEKAVPLEGRHAPQPGYEVIPTPAAESLVDYILSLRKAYPIPGVTAVLAGSGQEKQ